YALLDYSPLARPNYAYKLEGFDSDWVPAGNRNFVQYTNLRPGTYRFTVKAVKTGDAKTSESAETVFVIKQLLFLRWYFLLLYLVITAAFVFMVLKLRTLAHTRKRLDELEHIQRTLQKENKKLESLTYKDSLTGVYNRHGLTAYLKKIWPLLVKDKDSLAVLMVDIDYFKTYNDTHGHLAGDKILKIIASTLKDVTKKEGNVFRYGGDEFVVLLARHECGSANFFAERIRENVENKTSELFDGSLTVSIGVFVWTVTNCNSYEDFIAKADTALYCAKQNGRNRVCCL
ncbi:diguanylate cyclase, partial [Treponema lecithinolyticum]